MHRDHQRWYSHRLNRDMGVAFYGNYGAPILAFPTSCGDYGRKPNVRFVRVGTLDKPSALKPDVHIYTRWNAKWLKLPKRTPSFRDYYNTSKLWPKASLKRLNAALGKTES